MPYGRWPDRVGPFRKWASNHVTKAKITDSATGSRTFKTRRRRRRKRKKRE